MTLCKKLFLVGILSLVACMHITEPQQALVSEDVSSDFPDRNRQKPVDLLQKHSERNLDSLWYHQAWDWILWTPEGNVAGGALLTIGVVGTAGVLIKKYIENKARARGEWEGLINEANWNLVTSLKNEQERKRDLAITAGLELFSMNNLQTLTEERVSARLGQRDGYGTKRHFEVLRSLTEYAELFQLCNPSSNVGKEVEKLVKPSDWKDARVALAFIIWSHVFHSEKFIHNYVNLRPGTNNEEEAFRKKYFKFFLDAYPFLQFHQVPENTEHYTLYCTLKPSWDD